MNLKTRLGTASYNIFYTSLSSKCCEAQPEDESIQQEPIITNGEKSWVGVCGKCHEHSEFDEEPLVDGV